MSDLARIRELSNSVCIVGVDESDEIGTLPGKSQLTIEAVYRPTLDPSRPERDLEVIAPHASEGDQIASQLADAMKKRFGE